MSEDAVNLYIMKFIIFRTYKIERDIKKEKWIKRSGQKKCIKMNGKESNT